MNPAWRELPVRTALPALHEALEQDGTAVLAAPPGTGKTTLVPLALAGLLSDGRPVRRVLVAEPRRLAVRAAARRMAWLLGEAVGSRVGYTVRGERRAGPETVVEVVTTGVLLQRLQRDQELPGVDVVVLDECHERHLDADTALAFLLDVRAALRPELRLVCASATSDTEAWAELLGGAPVVEAHGVSHPVDVVWAPPPRAVRPAHGTRVDPALLDHVAAVVRRALGERDGDVLCFLPGVGEIARVAGQLGGVSAEVLQLHGRAPQAVQDAALSAGQGRRVVLTTAVAESSLTVPGVRIVVDAGLAREPRTDHARGLAGLVTVRASLAAARQRAGRAGREAPGTVYRCWHEAEDARAARFPTPEIALADLTSFALQAACWGDPDATGLALPDAPPAGAMAAARQTLIALGAVSSDGRATPRGTRLARTGLHPRLARALIDGAPAVGARRAAEVVALLSEEPPRALGDDLGAVWRTVRSAGDPYAARWRDEVRRLQRSASDEPTTPLPDATAVGLVVALAFPERIARARVERPAPGERSPYLMASGTAAEPARDTRLGALPWLAVAVADRPAGSHSARILHAAALDEDTAHQAGAALLTAREEVHWDTRRGEVVSRRVESLGAIELTEKPLSRPDPALVRAALLEGLAREGISTVLTWPSPGLRERLAFLRNALGDPWPDVSDGALLERADEWLEPELSRARRRADLARIDTTAALQRLLPWATGEAGRLDELAPERITVPSGSRIRVDYSTERPFLAVKLQELFGWTVTPALAGGRVPLTIHLLSPAGRPAAVTGDLASFWQNGYPAVRADLRGRYPRHPWPEDPTTAEPTRRTNARK
ncbi:ATP-dependent helicase HrpB [Kitasatospora aureofaciens]|uniref:ATP-dependent helicase n=1 Tax=Kitasatospora aureofaciens TaxID=1894 RepID=A0A1E7N4N6_KITAU|nr:ATP-dependent helicase HrpB [Kitasatospora aureofaciens]ARF80826.1 ATP-dependent helicase HrpB [Kitasatospora aureofaciens]OEV35632.1 ATP-dependent helicase HrpB [Kitasatospora aureofaciens]GGU62352.1 ATP-dependent helicase [Kitasatospora aureofaciens]